MQRLQPGQRDTRINDRIGTRRGDRRQRGARTETRIVMRVGLPEDMTVEKLKDAHRRI
jgi:hypothetical protein